MNRLDTFAKFKKQQIELYCKDLIGETYVRFLNRTVSAQKMS